MKQEVSSRPEALSQVQNTDLKVMKKQIITLGITATLALSAFLVGLNETQFVQQDDQQASFEQINFKFLLAEDGDNWNGG